MFPVPAHAVSLNGKHLFPVISSRSIAVSLMMSSCLSSFMLRVYTYISASCQNPRHFWNAFPN